MVVLKNIYCHEKHKNIYYHQHKQTQLITTFELACVDIHPSVRYLIPIALVLYNNIGEPSNNYPARPLTLTPGNITAVSQHRARIRTRLRCLNYSISSQFCCACLSRSGGHSPLSSPPFLQITNYSCHLHQLSVRTSPPPHLLALSFTAGKTLREPKHQSSSSI